MMATCKRHYRSNCSTCLSEARRTGRADDYFDNAGSLGINTDGDLAIGLGGGLTIDLDDGSIGFGGNSSGFGGFDS